MEDVHMEPAIRMRCLDDNLLLDRKEFSSVMLDELYEQVRDLLKTTFDKPMACTITDSWKKINNDPVANYIAEFSSLAFSSAWFQLKIKAIILCGLQKNFTKWWAHIPQRCLARAETENTGSDKST